VGSSPLAVEGRSCYGPSSIEEKKRIREISAKSLLEGGRGRRHGGWSRKTDGKDESTGEGERKGCGGRVKKRRDAFLHILGGSKGNSITTTLLGKKKKNDTMWNVIREMLPGSLSSRAGGRTDLTCNHRMARKKVRIAEGEYGREKKDWFGFLPFHSQW